MSEIKFFACVLVPVEPMAHVHGSDHKKFGTLNDRLPEGKCENCGGTEWYFLPVESVAVREGGKPYIECLNCGNIEHL
jgi:hypothetical protein